MSSSYGDGDPAIPAAAREAHARAEREGGAAYLDPDTGYSVHCASALRCRGACCGLGCRHCPYARAEQHVAGRAVLRPLSADPGRSV